jgi:hypothetical protein
MSYEPTIIALKKDLDKNRELIVDGDWQYEGTKENKKDEKTRGGEFNQTVMEYIKNAYENNNVVRVGGIELILMEPQLTSYNEAVRNKLYELKINFGISN